MAGGDFARLCCGVRLYALPPYNRNVNPSALRKILVSLVTGVALSACGQVVDQTPTPVPTLSLPTPRATLTPRPTPTLAPPTVISPREARPTPTPVVYLSLIHI